MSFSRLQLAAALIEYDNDELDNKFDRKDAKQSAIFNITRRTRNDPPLQAYQNEQNMMLSEYSGSYHSDPSRQKQTDDGMSMSMGMQKSRTPSGDLVSRRGTIMTTGTARYSEPIEDLEMEEPHGEVDLASWGIPENFIAKEPVHKRVSSTSSRASSAWAPQPNRTQSLIGMVPLKGDYDDRQEELRPLSPSIGDAISAMRSVTPYVDLSDRAGLPREPASRNVKSHRDRTVSFHDFTAQNDQQEVLEEIPRPRSSMSILDRGRFQHPAFPESMESVDDISLHTGRMSSASVGFPASIPLPGSPRSATVAASSQTHARAESEESVMPNPFALPAPAGDRSSRFDPKYATLDEPHRPDSRATGYFGADAGIELGEIRMPSYPSAQPVSPQVYKTPARISMFRPKTLLMPMPLQGLHDPRDSAPLVDERGFMKGRKPLPPGALRPNSLIGSLSIPRGLNQMSLSQKIFSDSLSVDGARGSHFVGGVKEDGQVAFHALGGEPAGLYEEYESNVKEKERLGMEEWRASRPVAGVSLMDEIEDKKKAQHAKRRVFAGDSRPSMMSRDDNRRSRLGSPGSDARSPNSRPDRRKPLLNLEPSSPTGTHRTAQFRPDNDPRRSVFGVDQVWQKDMAKLKRQQQAEEVAGGRAPIDRHPSLYSQVIDEAESDIANAHAYEDEGDDELQRLQPAAEIQDEAPLLPAFITAAEAAKLRASKGFQTIDIDDWAASDDEATPRRKKKGKKGNKGKPAVVDESSDEDVPLSKVFDVTNVAINHPPRDDSSDDEPLSKIAAKFAPPALPPISQIASPDRSQVPPVKHIQRDEDDDDDVPLAIRRLTMLNNKSSNTNGSVGKTIAMTHAADEDDDDIPLGQRHLAAGQNQLYQRESMMFMQQQQQQQEQQAMMMFQQQNMMGNPFGMPANMGMPMMGMGMGMPMMSPYSGVNLNMMLPPPMQPPQDPGIDRWRRAVETREGSVINGAGIS